MNRNYQAPQKTKLVPWKIDQNENGSTALYTQPASHLGPLSARQRNAIRMAFRWRADGCPILRVCWVKNMGG